MRRGSAEVAVVLMVALLAVGGCAGEPEPAPASTPGATPPGATPPGTSPPGATPPPASGLSPAPPLPLPQPQPPGGPVRPEPGLGAEDRARLVDARRIGARWVVLLVATAPGRTGDAAAALTDLGGVVGTTSPGPGYLRVSMPTDKVERAAALPAITALDVEQVIPPNPPRPTR
ncbi:MAG TPA: hypothetical protein VFQ77_20235 [Pseudonocardiaceae bacterium]|nr:hypothetical protein [Pseudonocardiaceae bacterium]